MPDTTNEQTVVDGADTQAKQASEAEGARTQTLEELLASYESNASDPQPASPSVSDDKATDGGSDNKVAELERKFAELERQNQEAQYQTDVSSAVKAIRGDLPSEIFTDAHMEGWLTAEAKRDPRIAKAWMDRADNPQLWGQIQSQLSTRFSDWLKSLPDAKATEDRAAIADAVRGASTTAPKGDDVDEAAVRKMSDSEFETYVAEMSRGG